MFTLDKVVPWGRSFDEYRRMFALTDADLRGRILGCGDGPAAFNAEATRLGMRVTSAIHYTHSAPSRFASGSPRPPKTSSNKPDVTATISSGTRSRPSNTCSASGCLRWKIFLPITMQGEAKDATSQLEHRRSPSPTGPSISPSAPIFCFSTQSSWELSFTRTRFSSSAE